MTAKPSIYVWGVLYKSGVHAVKVLCLTPGGLPAVQGNGLSTGQPVLIDWQKSAEGIVGAVCGAEGPNQERKRRHHEEHRDRI